MNTCHANLSFDCGSAARLPYSCRIAKVPNYYEDTGTKNNEFQGCTPPGKLFAL